MPTAERSAPAEEGCVRVEAGIAAKCLLEQAQRDVPVAYEHPHRSRIRSLARGLAISLPASRKSVHRVAALAGAHSVVFSLVADFLHGRWRLLLAIFASGRLRAQMDTHHGCFARRPMIAEPVELRIT